MSNLQIEAFQLLADYSLATISASFFFTPCKTIVNCNHILVRETQNKPKEGHRDKNVEERRRNMTDSMTRSGHTSLVIQ